MEYEENCLEENELVNKPKFVINKIPKEKHKIKAKEKARIKAKEKAKIKAKTSAKGCKANLINKNDKPQTILKKIQDGSHVFNGGYGDMSYLLCHIFPTQVTCLTPITNQCDSCD